MTDRQENKLSMAKTVQLVLNNNSAIVSTPTAFSATKTELDAEITSIDGIAQVQTINNTGSAKDKTQAENTAIDKAIALIGPAKSCARAQNNNTLYESLNYSKSDLKKLRDTTLPQTLTQIRDVLQNNLALFTDYGITADDITDFTAQIAAITPLQSAPRNAITTGKAATTALRAEFKNLDAILKRLDGLAAGKSKYPDFYNAYKAARVIVDTKAKGGEGKGDDGGNQLT